MTQSNPLQIEEVTQEILEAENSTQFQEEATRRAVLVTRAVAANTVLFFALGIYLAITTGTWQAYTFVYATVQTIIASLIGATLIKRGKHSLGAWISLIANLFGAVLTALTVFRIGYVALAYIPISSYFAVRYALPKESRRLGWVISSLGLIIAILSEVINPAWRLVSQLMLTLTPIITGTLGVAFIAVIVREAWNRSYTVGRKLLIAFGLLGLLTLVVGIGANFGLSTVTNAYDHALEDGGELRAISLTLSNDLLTARRHEKDFLLRWTDQGFDTAYENYVVPNRETIENMLGHIDSMQSFGPAVGETFSETYSQAEYQADLVILRDSTELYEQEFQNTVQLIQEKGFQDTGLEGEFRTAVRNIEARILDREGLDPLVITMLSIRRHEKDYLLRGDQTYIDQTHERVEELKQQISASEVLSASEKAQIRSLADQYIAAFDKLVEKDIQIAAAIQAFRDAAHTMEPIVEKIANTGQEMSSFDASTANTADIQMRTLLTVVMIVALLVAGFLAVFLSRQISQPVLTLTSSVSELEKGNYDVQAEVTSADEIGTLANAFNGMASQLKASVGQIAERAKALEVSADVSRRLTSILDPQQLAAEVVGQVQTAFDYYYAQIYLFDDAGENLVLTAGTGEAGAEMTKRGHSLAKGRGLVGRAAESKESILVTDTAQDPDWLPNELLPDTKAEVAVPIIVGEKVWGVLDVQDDVTNDITSDDVTVLESLASQVAISLQNARTYVQAEQQQRQSVLVLETAGEGIFGLDTEGNHTFVNQAASRLLGYSLEELIGKHSHSMWHHTHADGTPFPGEECPIYETLKTGKAKHGEEYFIRKDGTGLHVSFSSQPIREEGKITGAVVTFADITQQKLDREMTASRARQQETINLVTQRIQSATTIEEAMQVAARELGHALGQKQTAVALEPSALGDNGKDN